MNLERLWRPALDIVLPERCPACGKITPSGGHFCVDCWQSIQYLSGPACQLCNLPLPFAEHSEQCCGTCLQKPPIHDGICAAVAYGDIAREVALRLKYGGKIGLAKMIGAQLNRYLELENSAQILLIPVPLHWTRLWSRSYNQAALIAQSLAAPSPQLRYAPDILLRIKRTPYLRGMSAKQRKQTVGRAFTVNPKRRELLPEADVILVDDIYTTGATTDACVRMLKKAGAKRVRIFCWARVLPGAVTGRYAEVTDRTALDLTG
jgi:ComF family protein